MKNLIINADDFGRHQLINRAVEECFQNGCLRSTTLMAGGEAFEDAVEVAKRNPALGIGIHFTLANGNPVLDPKSIPSLVESDGKFCENYIEFIKRFALGKIDSSEIRAELGAQLEKIQKAGIKLTHFDSHQHLHHLPRVTKIALDLAESVGIRAMRKSDSKIFDGSLKNLGQLIGRLGLSSLAKISASQAHRRGFVTPEYFSGIVAGEAVDEEFMDRLIDKLDEGTTELMIHPGADNQILRDFCDWNHDFESERSALISPRILQKLRDKNIRAINFENLVTPQ